jgi:hypothetical protein
LWYNGLGSVPESDRGYVLRDCADEFGYGYNDAQGLPGSAQTSSIEVDIAEMTPVSFSVTLHGKIHGGYDSSGAQVNVHNFTGYPDRNVNCKLSRQVGDGPMTLITEWPTWDTYGPTNSFTINTLESFNVSSKITVDASGAMTLLVEIDQDNATTGLTNKLYLEVISNKDEFSPGSVNLKNMNLVVSNWAISGDAIYSNYYNASTWWLDGFNVRDTLIDYRGWVAESQAQKDQNSTDDNGDPWTSEIAVAQDQVLDPSIAAKLDASGVSEYFTNYDYVYETAKAMKNHEEGMRNHVCFSGIFNLQITSGIVSTLSTTKEMPVWIMDAVYRGYVQEKMATYDYDSDKSLSFTGRYMGGFGNLYSYRYGNSKQVVPVDEGTISTLENGWDEMGGDFFNFQRCYGYESLNYSTQKQTEYYDLSYDGFWTDNTRKQRMDHMMMKERYVTIKIFNGWVQQSEYSINNPWTMFKYGLNYLDAPGVLLNNAIFEVPTAI